MVFLDESGFLLIPTRRRTWGPEGHPPIMRYNYKHDRISALAALSVSAQRRHMGLYIRFQQDNFTAMHVAHFLRLLLQHLRGAVVLVWDNGRIHRGPVIRQVQKQFSRLHLEHFPGYAPELNPVEYLWGDFDGRLANSLLRDSGQLRSRLHASKTRVSSSQPKLRSFVLAAELPSPPW